MSGFAGLQVENEVVRRAQRGDHGALDILFRTLAPAVYTICYRLCQSRATADDLTQETFVEVMRHLPDFRFDASLATWVRTIAVSRALMYLRSAWHRKATAIDAITEQPHLADADIARSVQLCSDIGDALALLSPTARAVVWLYDVEGYSHKEIAAAMGKSVSFSKSCLSRAHERLRAALDAGDAGLATDASMRGDEAQRPDDGAAVVAERCMA